MLFPLRCAFWLTIVYTSIVWPGASTPGLDVAKTALGNVATRLSTAAADRCLTAPTSCTQGLVALSQAVGNVVPVAIPRVADAKQPVKTASGTDTLRKEDRSAHRTKTVERSKATPTLVAVARPSYSGL